MSATWTKPSIRKLDALWASGQSASEIAKQIGRTRNAVIGKIHRRGMEKRARHNWLWSDDEIFMLRSLRKTRMPLAEIALRVGHSEWSCGFKARSLGMPRKPRAPRMKRIA